MRRRGGRKLVITEDGRDPGAAPARKRADLARLLDARSVEWARQRAALIRGAGLTTGRAGQMGYPPTRRRLKRGLHRVRSKRADPHALPFAPQAKLGIRLPRREPYRSVATPPVASFRAAHRTRSPDRLRSPPRAGRMRIVPEAGPSMPSRSGDSSRT